MMHTSDTQRVTRRKLAELEEDIERERRTPLDPGESEAARQVTLRGMQVLARQMREEIDRMAHGGINGSKEGGDAPTSSGAPPDDRSGAPRR
jgi:hypothetical protein